MRRWALLWLVASGGCAFELSFAPGRCFLPSDCPNPSDQCTTISSEDSGFCVSQDPNPLTFALDISPLPGQGVLRHQQIFSSTELFSADPLQATLGSFALEQAVPVSGLVVALGAVASPQVVVRATNLNPPLISGTGLEVFETTSDAKGLFTLEVRPGLYDITATATSDSALPPLVLKAVSLPLNNNEALAINLDPSLKAQGVLLADGQPLEGVRVLARAEDDVLGLRSTIATTGPDGSFVLSLSPGEAQLIFHYEPLAGSPNAFIPNADELVVLGALPTLNGVLDLGVRELGPRQTPFNFIGHVDGPGASFDTTTDADSSTIVTFNRIEPNGSDRSFSRRVIVDELGDYSVVLLPGTYDVSVQTPPASELASSSIGAVPFLCDAEPCVGVDLQLARRHKIFGELFNAAGQSLTEELTIEARPAGKPEGSPISSTTSFSGLNSFEIFLDPGEYDLTFLSSGSGGIAPGFLFSAIVGPDSDTASDITIPSASLLVGQIASNDPTGAVTPPAVTIRAFAVSASDSFYLLNTATSNTSGDFFLVVPNPSADAQLFSPLLP